MPPNEHKADEQLLAMQLKSVIEELLNASDIPFNIETRLEHNQPDEFRKLTCSIRTAADSFSNAIAVLQSEFSILARTDKASPPHVALQCNLPTFIRMKCSLPKNYPQTFAVDLMEVGQLDTPTTYGSNGEKEAKEQNNMKSKVQPRGRKITLLLSGGGFRATLYHLGVVRYLRESNRLNDVVEIFSVSGGSIIAAHMALNWGDYTGNESQFDRAGNELVKFTKLGLRERIIRSMFLFWLILITAISVAFSMLTIVFNFTPLTYFGLLIVLILFATIAAVWLDKRFRAIQSLSRGYRTLVGSRELRNIDSSAPKTYFLATNLTTGNIACFFNDGVYPDIVEGTPKRDLLLIRSVNCKIADCIAASSAFPPLFSPYELSPKALKVDNVTMDEKHYLTDGGVYDNLGVRACTLLTDNKNGEVLVSDAERKFDKSTGATYRWLLSRASRSTDVLMHRVNKLEFEILKGNASDKALERSFSIVRFARLQSDNETPPGQDSVTLSPDLSRRVRRIRTDLDSFSDLEIQLLYTKGLVSARSAFEDQPDLGKGIALDKNGIPIGVTAGRWLPVTQLLTKDTDDIHRQLEFGEKPTWLKQWDWRSPACWLGLFFILLLAIVNPLSIGIIRSGNVTPVDLRCARLIPIDGDVPPEYRLVSAFLLEALDKQPPGKIIKFFILESNLLDDASLYLSPAPFRFELKTSDKITVFYSEAFLLYNLGNSLSSIQAVDEGSKVYDVQPDTGQCKIVMLLGVASASDAQEEVDLSNFQMVVRG